MGNRYVLAFGLCLLLLFGKNSLATTKSPEPSMDECPAHLVCFTPEEAHKINVKLIELERDLKIAKAKRLKRFGFTAGCGVGQALNNEEIDINCGVSYGFRW